MIMVWKLMQKPFFNLNWTHVKMYFFYDLFMREKDEYHSMVFHFDWMVYWVKKSAYTFGVLGCIFWNQNKPLICTKNYYYWKDIEICWYLSFQRWSAFSWNCIFIHIMFKAVKNKSLANFFHFKACNSISVHSFVTYILHR